MTITAPRPKPARPQRKPHTVDPVIIAAIATGTRHWFGRSAPTAQTRIDAMTTRQQIRAERRAHRRRH